MWREFWTRLGITPAVAESRAGTHNLAPIALTVLVAIACINIAAVSSARHADDVALHRERQLFADAIAGRRARLTREAEIVSTSNAAVDHAWLAFDAGWIHRNIGLRLAAFFGHDHVFVIDSSDHFAYAMSDRTSVDPASFAESLGELSALIDDVRGRRASEMPDEIEPGRFDPLTKQIRRPARASRFQSFMGRPAIVAAAAMIPEDDALVVPDGPPPIVVIVNYVSGSLLQEIATDLEFADLRLVDSQRVASGDNETAFTDDEGRTVARFAWTSKRPGSTTIRNVIPYLAAILGCFLLLGALIVRHTRHTAARIAAGEDQLRHLALHDPLSGLPNRTYFGERLAALIEEVRRTDQLAAVLSIDLDRFKDVNDTLGHLVGDALICAVSQRLIRVVRSGDLVARLGGDEFAVITSSIRDLDVLEGMIDRIIETLRSPFAIMGHTIVIGASIGVALVERRSGSVADIMRYADVALYRAKNDGRNRACIYDAHMDADLRERKQLEHDLREAINNDGLSLAFQPIMNPSGDVMVGVEALCRWRHPTRGDVSPSDFIPIAEHSELIVPLGEWVLRRACRQAAAWPGLSLAVNVSPLQFRRPDFVEVVERILTETGLERSRLELELTESTLIGNVEDAEAAMRRLKSLGVRFALDDFGTGYSSLLYLRTFPFDKLKIDRSFVHNIESAPDAAAIVHAVVSLGRGLGMKVTAEGVETAEQHLFLRAAGIHSIQGYRFGRPSDAAKIDEWLARQYGTPSLWSAAVAI